MKLFLSDLHLSDGKERDDFQYHKAIPRAVTQILTIQQIIMGGAKWLFG